MDGTYEIGTDHIRALAIQSHALDVQFDKLFNSETICDKSEATIRTYNRLLSTTLFSVSRSRSEFRLRRSRSIGCYRAGSQQRVSFLKVSHRATPRGSPSKTYATRSFTQTTSSSR